MKVLVVSPMIPWRDGGGAIPVLLYAQLVGLTKRHELTLLTAIGDEPGEAQALEDLRAQLPEVTLCVVDRRVPSSLGQRLRRRVRLAATWLRGRWPWRTVWFADPGFQRELDRLGRESDFDVISVEDDSLAMFDLPAGVPSVLTMSEVRRPRTLRRPGGRPAAWPGWAVGELDWHRLRRYQHRVWRRFGLIQVFCERDSDAMALLAPDVAPRVRVNPFGLILPPVADLAAEREGTLVFVGNFAHVPNRDAALWLAREIMPAVLAAHPGATLRIIGTAPPPEILGLAGPGIEVIADAPTVEPEIEAAAVVLAPVRIGGGMRMKVLQALAMGKAVVTTSRGAEGYTVFDEAPPFLVADDAEGIVAAAGELLGDAERRHALGRRAREFAESHHSPEAWEKRLEVVYEEARRAGAGASHGR